MYSDSARGTAKKLAHTRTHPHTAHTNDRMQLVVAKDELQSVICHELRLPAIKI